MLSTEKVRKNRTHKILHRPRPGVGLGHAHSALHDGIQGGVGLGHAHNGSMMAVNKAVLGLGHAYSGIIMVVN